MVSSIYVKLIFEEGEINVYPFGISDIQEETEDAFKTVSGGNFVYQFIPREDLPTPYFDFGNDTLKENNMKLPCYRKLMKLDESKKIPVVQICIPWFDEVFEMRNVKYHRDDEEMRMYLDSFEIIGWLKDKGKEV